MPRSPGTGCPWAQCSFSLGCHPIGKQRGREIWHSGVRQVQGFPPFGRWSECIPVSSQGPGALRIPHTAGLSSHLTCLTQPHPDPAAASVSSPCSLPPALPIPIQPAEGQGSPHLSPSLFLISFMHSISHICKT